MSPTRTALYGCAMALAIGLLPLPYAYYTFLRFAAVAAFLMVGYVAATSRSWATLVIAVCAVLIFNPVVPLRMPKDAWACVDDAAAAYLAIIASHIATGFASYGPPERTVEAIAKVVGFAVLLGLLAGVGLTVTVAMVVIPLKWIGMPISGKFMNFLGYGAACAAAAAVLAGHAYHSGSKPHVQSVV